jgi:muramidase (phage lysozyme)
MRLRDRFMAIYRRVEEAVSKGRYRPVSTREQLKKATKSTRPALFDLIGQKEAQGNYNAFFGNARNQDVKFTEMKVKDVRAWQERFVANGSESSAVGKYQIIRSTMDGLIKNLNLTGDELFDEALQDRMAGSLADGRGYSKWKAGKISDEKFANNLAKEWASFPVVGGKGHGRSYYAGDGLNKSLISPDAVLEALKNDRKSLTG